MPASHGAKSAGAMPAAETAPAPLGVDAATLKLMNSGQWQLVSERLEANLARGGAQLQRQRAWLAFAYLFLNKCDSLKKLAGEKLEGAQEPGPDRWLVDAFSQMCQGNLDEAQKIVDGHNAPHDPLYTFAVACLAGKRGQATTAAAYCETTVELAPGFGWGYRTLGYLEDRWLKDARKAEQAFKKALAIEPNFREVRDMLVDVYLTENNFDGAIDVALAGIKAGPKEPLNYFRLAQIYTQQWRLREALAQLDKAVALSAGDPRFHRARASILRYQGHADQAVAEQQKAVNLAKDKTFELVELANLNLAAGNSNRAIDNLKDSLKLDPGNDAAYQKLVLLLKQEKRYDDLAQEYRQAIARKPKDVNLRLGLARALNAAGKAEEAIKELKEAAAMTEVDPQPHRELAQILVARKEYSAAAKEYTRALNINPGSADDLVALGFCYAHNDDYLQAETALVTALALQQLNALTGAARPQNHADVTRSLAVLFLTEGRYADAATQLEAICASTKASAFDQFLLAQSKALRDRTSASAAALKEAYGKLPEPERKAQRVALADTLIKMGKSEEAGTFLDAIPSAEVDGDGQLLVLRARAHRLKGDLKEAARLASRAVALKDEDAERQAESHLENGLIEAAAGNQAAADNEIRLAIELNPKSFAAYEASGRIYLAKGDWQNAIESARRSQEINPYFVHSHLLMGEALEAAGKLKEASASYKKAVELYPGLVQAHKNLLKTYEKLSMKEDARAEAESVRQIESRN